MYDGPIPADFGNIEEWLLHYLYHHPNDKHSTQSLREELDQVLSDEPSQLEECNRLRRLMRAPALSAVEYAAQRKPELTAVQRAVETLIKEGWAKGERGADDRGVIFFSEIDLSGSGTKEAIRRMRAKEESVTAPRSFESSLREARRRAGLDRNEG
jgi:hypothetical protein